jgi:nitrogen fixation protein NifQ
MDRTHTDLYAYLMRGAAPSACSAFDSHLLASVLTITSWEAAGDGRHLLAATGLDRTSLLDLVWRAFPHAHESMERAIPEDAVVAVGEEEVFLRDLLSRSSSDNTVLEQRFAVILARRCQRPHHLWQDLGLRSRRELSWLMECHFAPLAARNARDMKWKKFLYRTICRDDGLLLCVAPTCSECHDYQRCFGDEAGDSLLEHQPGSMELGERERRHG